MPHDPGSLPSAHLAPLTAPQHGPGLDTGQGRPISLRTPDMEPITTTRALAEACERLSKHPFVTVDTEFLRESTYYPMLCVAQLASTEEAFVVDALAEGIDLTPFYELMADETVIKVFHAARQDIEIC